MTAKALPRMDEDTRLEPILANLSQGFIAGMGSEWGTSENTGEGIRAEMVDELAHKHFPMCMRNLHDNLKRDHHLKHFGRLQYGLFLKVGLCHWKSASYNFCAQVLGLSIEEALAFWRRSFSGYTDDQFNKQYKYNIRHSYGLEGRRANYPAKRYVPRWLAGIGTWLTCCQLPANFDERPARCLGFSRMCISALLSEQSSNGIVVDVFPTRPDGGRSSRDYEHGSG